MYWMKTKSLKHDLQTGTFTERDAIPYIIAESILVQLALFGGSEHIVFDSLNIIIGIAAIITGTWYVFNKHDKDSASSFLSKYVSIGWVVTVQCLLMLFPLAIVITVPAMLIGNQFWIGFCEIVFFVVFYLVYYYLLGKHISDT